MDCWLLSCDGRLMTSCPRVIDIAPPPAVVGVLRAKLGVNMLLMRGDTLLVGALLFDPDACADAA